MTSAQRYRHSSCRSTAAAILTMTTTSKMWWLLCLLSLLQQLIIRPNNGALGGMRTVNAFVVPTSSSSSTRNALSLTTTSTTITTPHHHVPTRLQAVGKTGGTVMATAQEFETTVLQATEYPVMVFFTAPWCGPCRLSIPVVKDVSKEYADRLRIVEVCTDDLPAVASNANVVSIPTIQMYYQGQVVDTIVGCVAKSVLCTAVEKVLEDVTAV